MALPRVSPRLYRVVTLVAALSTAFIILTGAAVRLTGSGLGCPTWPRCDSSHLVRVTATDMHQNVEQINRLITGLVSVAVILAVLGSLRRTPRRRDLVRLSLALVGGVVAQIVLGGITVLTDLNPFAVQGHFVLSMALLTAAVVLHHRAGEADAPRRPNVSPALRRWVVALVVATAVAITLGTVVTGSGPHGGDERAHRFDLAVRTAARFHSIAVILTVALALWLVRLAFRRRAEGGAVLVGPLTAWCWVAVLQGIVGYTQYFEGVPALLVFVHVLGAVLLWWVTLRVLLATRIAVWTGVSAVAPMAATTRVPPPDGQPSPAWR
jgi:cytochrome c oxidase assembly protein subunit 15